MKAVSSIQVFRIFSQDGSCPGAHLHPLCKLTHPSRWGGEERAYRGSPPPPGDSSILACMNILEAGGEAGMPCPFLSRSPAARSSTRTAFLSRPPFHHLVPWSQFLPGCSTPVPDNRKHCLPQMVASRSNRPRDGDASALKPLSGDEEQQTLSPVPQGRWLSCRLGTVIGTTCCSPALS